MDINERILIAREKLKKCDVDIYDDIAENISDEEAYNQALVISHRILARVGDNENTRNSN